MGTKFKEVNEYVERATRGAQPISGGVSRNRRFSSDARKTNLGLACSPTSRRSFRRRARKHTGLLCHAQRRLYGPYLRDGQRLLPRRGTEYRSDPRARGRRDSWFIVGTVPVQQLGELGGQRRGTRRAGKNRLHESVSAELHFSFDQAGHHFSERVGR